MPKLKTVKGVKERMKITGTGKVLRYRPGRRHLLTGRRNKLLRGKRRPALVSRTEERRIKALMPYA